MNALPAERRGIVYREVLRGSSLRSAALTAGCSHEAARRAMVGMGLGPAPAPDRLAATARGILESDGSNEMIMLAGWADGTRYQASVSGGGASSRDYLGRDAWTPTEAMWALYLALCGQTGADHEARLSGVVGVRE